MTEVKIVISYGVINWLAVLKPSPFLYGKQGGPWMLSPWCRLQRMKYCPAGKFGLSPFHEHRLNPGWKYLWRNIPKRLVSSRMEWRPTIVRDYLYFGSPVDQKSLSEHTKTELRRLTVQH